MMTETKDLPEKKGTPPISKQVAYSKAASHFMEAFDTILEVMRTSRNPSDKLGAARTIINKVIPDLKAESLVDDEGNTYKVLLDIPGVKVVKNEGNSIQSVSELPAETTTGV